LLILNAGGVMSRLSVIVVGAGLMVGVGALAAHTGAGLSAQPAQTEGAAQPWQTGGCYRVYRIGNDVPEIFKVAASPEGSWVRVEADPRAPWVPGGRPTARVWLNLNSVFVVQEWSCSTLP
jgi:hypothetical protein